MYFIFFFIPVREFSMAPWFKKSFLIFGCARFYGLKCRASFINFVVTAILNK